VPVANSDDISDAAAAGFETASACKDDGKAENRARLAEALKSSQHGCTVEI
jgi:hypothetical protein